MNQEIIDFSRFIDYFVYSDNILEVAKDYLKKIFDADNIYFHNTYIRNRHCGIFLPIAVEGKNVGYCEIVGIKNKLSREDINLVVNLLMQLFTKVKVYIENSIKEHRNLVYDMNQLKIYRDNIDMDNLLILNCLIINIYDYEMIIQKYGLESANYMMEMAVDAIKDIFKLPSDTIFRYTNNQIIVFITNRNSFSIQSRIDELKNRLNSNCINAIFGLSSTIKEFDLNNLMSHAEQYMNNSINNFGKY